MTCRPALVALLALLAASPVAALGAERPLRLLSTGGADTNAVFAGASADGTRVFFVTAEALPGTGDGDAALDVYERTAAGALRLLSTSGDDTNAAFAGASADGTRVFFETTEPGDADTIVGVYERTADGALRLISTGDANTHVHFRGASADGTRVFYETLEAIPGTGDADAASDVYERSADGALRLLSTSGAATNAGFAGASADGTRVFFTTTEAIPGTGDADAALDLYERTAAGTLRLISTGGADRDVVFAGASADGTRVWFVTSEAIPGTGDADAAPDLYERTADGALRLLSTSGATISVFFQGASADGTRVFFTTTEAIPGTGDADTAPDTYERTVDGALRLITTGAADTAAVFRDASADGARVFFTTTEALPGTGDADTARDVYERTADGALRLISTSGANTDADFAGASADGRRVFFTTTEALPGTGDADTARDVYERTADGALRLLSTSGATANASFVGASDTGARVFFDTNEAIPGTGDADASLDLYEHALALPLGVSAPQLTGSAVVGGTLTCSDGAWDAEDLAPFARQWRRNGSPLGKVNPTHVVGLADLGTSLTCAVTATNPIGQTTGESAPVAIVAPSAAASTPNAAPRISRLTLTPVRLQAARTGGPIATKGGALLSFMLSEAARVEVRYARRTPGRRQGGSCRPEATRGARCTLTTTLAGLVRARKGAGAQTLRLSGRLAGRALPAGTYQVRVRARDRQGARSGTVTRTLTVLPRRSLS